MPANPIVVILCIYVVMGDFYLELNKFLIVVLDRFFEPEELSCRVPGIHASTVGIEITVQNLEITPVGVLHPDIPVICWPHPFLGIGVEDQFPVSTGIGSAHIVRNGEVKADSVIPISRHDTLVGCRATFQINGNIRGLGFRLGLQKEYCKSHEDQKNNRSYRKELQDVLFLVGWHIFNSTPMKFSTKVEVFYFAVVFMWNI